MQLLTADEMRSIEAAAIESGDVTGLALMERAGQGVVDAIFDEWPDLEPTPPSDQGASPSRSPEFFRPSEAQGSRRAVVLCGPGNNGGDGFVVARLLRHRGWHVAVFLYGSPEKLPPDAKTNCDRWRQIGPVGLINDDFDAGDALNGATLVIDALFGTGLTRPLEDLGDVLSALNEAAVAFSAAPSRTGAAGLRVVAVDMPSGIHTDTGRALEPAHGGCGAARANLTVTFHRAKLGHTRGAGPTACGKLAVKDIGL
jgi:hydroxyethylthiazole kinase-like uncharacterized protein yjeF